MRANTSLLPQSHLSADLSHALHELGKFWALSEHRPRLSLATKAHWDKLLNEWAGSDLPIVIRKSGGIRGSMIQHSSGRRVIIADNSPAQWSFSRAFEGQLLTLADIRVLLDKDSIPFAFATKTVEKASMYFKCTLSARDNLNKKGWKLCHIEEVGLNTQTAIKNLPIERLTKHFKLLMAPSNHFLVPIEWAGLGEIQEVIDEVRAVESQVRAVTEVSRDTLSLR